MTLLRSPTRTCICVLGVVLLTRRQSKSLKITQNKSTNKSGGGNQRWSKTPDSPQIVSTEDRGTETDVFWNVLYFLHVLCLRNHIITPVKWIVWRWSEGTKWIALLPALFWYTMHPVKYTLKLWESQLRREWLSFCPRGNLAQIKWRYWTWTLKFSFWRSVIYTFAYKSGMSVSLWLKMKW